MIWILLNINVNTIDKDFRKKQTDLRICIYKICTTQLHYKTFATEDWTGLDWTDLSQHHICITHMYAIYISLYSSLLADSNYNYS